MGDQLKIRGHGETMERVSGTIGVICSSHSCLGRGAVSSNLVAYPQKRRSSRIEEAIVLAVQGIDALREPYREEVTTGTISCHGCAYQLKHQVLPGDIVLLDTSLNVGQGAKGHSEPPLRARVKSIQKLNTPNDQKYSVGVELEIAGNVWGIASPPEDWFPEQAGKLQEPTNHGRELRLVARTEPQMVPARIEGGTPAPIPKRGDAASALSPWFSDLMGALSNQIHITISEIAAATLANEKNRMLEEFRVQLKNEAAGTIDRVVAASKDELARRVLKGLNDGAEAIVRTSHNTLVAGIERDMESAKQRMATQGNEVSQRIAGMATGTIERLERTFEASRTEAAERFVSRLREQVAPVVEEAKADLHKLVASQTVFKEESQAIYRQVTNQLESEANARLLQTHEELDKHSATVVSECNEKLLELSHTFDRFARDSAHAMIASATDDAKKDLEHRAAEISSDFTGQLEGHIRSYLEFIGQSIAEFPKNSSTS